MNTANAAQLIEASLIAVADAGIDVRHALFARFLAAFPERRALFLNLDAASRRMTDETLQMMYGLAQGERWVWPQIAELVVTHRNYGALTTHEYEAFIDLTVAVLGETVQSGWSDATAAAWTRQAEALKALVRRAQREWEAAIPEGRSFA